MPLHTPPTLPLMRANLPALLLLLIPLPLAAQHPPPENRGWSYEIEWSQRWLHGREQPRFTPFSSGRRWLMIHSASINPESRASSFHLVVNGFSGLDPQASVRVAPDGAVEIEVHEEHRPRFALETAEDSIQFLRFRLANRGRGVQLPESYAWELLPVLNAPRLQPGARWTDTLDLAAERDGFQQSLRGQRTRVVVGDTMVDGRRLWIVRDSAAVRYSERWLNLERTLDTVAVVQRAGEGMIRGRALIDPALPVAVARWDTTSISGEAVLRYPDGRVFRTPARMERTRHWTLYEPAGREARIAALRETANAERTGMLLLPTNDLEMRLSQGDTVLRDSLLAAWRGETDPDERARLFRLMDQWDSRDDAFGERLSELSIQAGDTVHAVFEAIGWSLSPRDPLSEEELDLLLPFLRDPGLPFAFGFDRDLLYESIRTALLRFPPALAADPGDWPCTPAACRQLAAQFEAAEEPRLRDLGLIARLVMEPARWDDEVLTRAREGSAMMEPAVLLVRGVGATWEAASKAPLPPPDADWRGWLEWMNGMDPAYRARHPDPPKTTAVRFDRSHERALRFYSERTGRDVVSELQRKLEQAPGDTARLVYDAILLGLGARQPDAEAVAERLINGSEAERARATREMLRLVESAVPADSALAVELMDRLLATVIEGAEPWPYLHPPAEQERAWGLRRLTGEHDSIFLRADSLPAALRTRWKDRVVLVSEGERRGSDRVGIHFQFREVRQVGPFVQLGIDYSEYYQREESPHPAGFAGGITVYLIRTVAGWRVVHSSRWIT